jgi:hypothetical protein
MLWQRNIPQRHVLPSSTAEDSKTHCQIGAADDVITYPRGGEANDDATYRHDGVAKDDSTYCRGGAATIMPNICVILKKNSQTRSCDFVFFCQ